MYRSGAQEVSSDWGWDYRTVQNNQEAASKGANTDQLKQGTSGSAKSGEGRVVLRLFLAFPFALPLYKVTGPPLCSS